MTSTNAIHVPENGNSTAQQIAATFCQIITTAQNAVLSLARLGLLLPLAGASAVSVVSRHATGHWTPWAALTAFFCIYSSYLIDHLSEVDAFDDGHASARSKRLASRRVISLGGGAAYVAALGIAAWQSGFTAALMLLSFPLAVVFYCVPVAPWRKAGKWCLLRLKDIPGFKAVYTAYFWAWLMSFTLLFHHTGKWGEHLAFGGFMFLSLFVNTVLCDFKDMERDRLESVPTLPLLLGPSRTFHLLHVISLAAGLWLLAAVLFQVLPFWCLMLLLTRFYSGLMLHGAASGTLDLVRIGEAGADFEFVLWLPLALAAL